MIENERLAKYYDLLYHNLDYVSGTRRIVEIIKSHNPKAKSLLDLACGTGTHMSLLQSDFICEGLDISEHMIDVAKRKVSRSEFHVADMKSFHLNKKYDSIICLFNSLNYLQNIDELEQTIHNSYSHLNPNGIMISELFDEKANFVNDFNNLRVYDSAGFKIVRLTELKRCEEKVEFNLNYLISKKGEELIYDREKFMITVFSHNTIASVFKRIGFDVQYLTPGFYGKGIFVGVKR